MNKKMPAMQFPIVKKNGKPKGVQRYKCLACHHQFSADTVAY